MNGKSVLSHAGAFALGAVVLLAVLLVMPPITSYTWLIWVGAEFSERSPKGHVDITVVRSDGTVEKLSVHNIIVTIGLRQVRNFLYGNISTANYNATDDIALSNDTRSLRL